MAESTHAAQMVIKLEALLLECAGLTSISVDGQSVSLADLKIEHRYWKKQVATESKTRPVVTTIKMSGI